MPAGKNICPTSPSPFGAVGSATIEKLGWLYSDPLQPSLPLLPRALLFLALLSNCRSVMMNMPLGWLGKPADGAGVPVGGGGGCGELLGGGVGAGLGVGPGWGAGAGPGPGAGAPPVTVSWMESRT